MEAFFEADRNYIILTNSGKPVFSQKADMYVLSSIYATLYAMVSKVQTYQFPEGPLVEDGGLPDYDLSDRAQSEVFGSDFSGSDIGAAAGQLERSQSMIGRMEEKKD